MFVEQYGKKDLPCRPEFFRARLGAEYFSTNNINVNVDIMFVEQYGNNIDQKAFFRWGGVAEYFRAMNIWCEKI